MDGLGVWKGEVAVDFGGVCILACVQNSARFH
jgi:hypothetical protein